MIQVENQIPIQIHRYLFMNIVLIVLSNFNQALKQQQTYYNKKYVLLVTISDAICRKDTKIQEIILICFCCTVSFSCMLNGIRE